MNETLTIVCMAFAFCFFLEGIEIAVAKKKNKVYVVIHILYPLFIVGTMIYFLMAGAVK